MSCARHCVQVIPCCWAILLPVVLLLLLPPAPAPAPKSCGTAPWAPPRAPHEAVPWALRHGLSASLAGHPPDQRPGRQHFPLIGNPGMRLVALINPCGRVIRAEWHNHPCGLTCLTASPPPPSICSSARRSAQLGSGRPYARACSHKHGMTKHKQTRHAVSGTTLVRKPVHTCVCVLVNMTTKGQCRQIQQRTCMHTHSYTYGTNQQ
jgi:hypothetical protein